MGLCPIFYLEEEKEEIAIERIVELLKDKEYHGRTFEELVEYFKDMNAHQLRQILADLEKDGIIAVSKKNKYFLAKDLGLYKGTISINKNG